MYAPLLMDLMYAERHGDLRRRSTSARHPRAMVLPVRRQGRGWWPKPRRSILRLAFQALRPSSPATPCVDC
jgi:hypothetical protein